MIYTVIFTCPSDIGWKYLLVLIEILLVPSSRTNDFFYPCHHFSNSWCSECDVPGYCPTNCTIKVQPDMSTFNILQRMHCKSVKMKITSSCPFITDFQSIIDWLMWGFKLMNHQLSREFDADLISKLSVVWHIVNVVLLLVNLEIKYDFSEN